MWQQKLLDRQKDLTAGVRTPTTLQVKSPEFTWQLLQKLYTERCLSRCPLTLIYTQQLNVSCDPFYLSLNPINADLLTMTLVLFSHNESVGFLIYFGDQNVSADGCVKQRRSLLPFIYAAGLVWHHKTLRLRCQGNLDTSRYETQLADSLKSRLHDKTFWRN